MQRRQGVEVVSFEEVEMSWAEGLRCKL